MNRNQPQMPFVIKAAIGAVVALIGVSFLWMFFVGHNNDQTWQIVQSPGGEVTVRQKAGYYFKGLSNVWTYPRVQSFEWDNVTVTFNDGGIATLDGSIRFRTPTTDEQCRSFHREFSGDESLQGVRAAIESHLINAIKVTGPVMSGSEHQSARKGEFYNLVFEQLRNGLYQAERENRVLQDQFDSGGQPITVFATRIITDQSGNPVVVEPSPLVRYGVEISQFSIEGTEYDPRTLELFEAKKLSMLNAERSKAEREEQVQERLMIIEKGLKEKAQVEAEANKDKAKRTIEGQMKVAVAEQEALQAQQILERQVTEAEARRQVAELDLEAERLNAEAVKVAAEAEEERIAKAGAITERDRVLAELAKETQIGVAAALSKIGVPTTMIVGGSEGGSSSMSNLVNLWLLKELGAITPNTAPVTGR